MMNQEQWDELKRKYASRHSGYVAESEWLMAMNALFPAILAEREAAQTIPPGYTIVPGEPTEAMLSAARDWSQDKYGKPIGNDAAIGCWQAMIAAAKGE